MKFLLSIFALVILISISAREGRAQDAATAPLQPTPTPQVAPTAPPATPVSKPAPAATVSASPAAEKKPTPRAEEAEPVATPAKKKGKGEKPPKHEKVDNSSNGKTGGGIVWRLENQWQRAIKNHDVDFVRDIVARDFIGVSSSGRVGDKSTMLYDAKRDRNEYKSVSSRNLTVHNFGPHVVVVLGVTTESGTTHAGKKFTYSYRFTDTWMDRDGKWQCVAAHAAVVPRR